MVGADKTAENRNNSALDKRTQLLLRPRKSLVHQRRGARVFFIRDDAATRINLPRCDSALIEHCREQSAGKSLAK